ncbi:MAG TPA: hypothetical protein VES58_06700 [Syntrophobacteria bacterium]|nr:hypothetical protein [Syntrophobacteria bacterium]
MTESNAVTWVAIAIFALAAMYFKGYITFPNAFKRPSQPATVVQVPAGTVSPAPAVPDAASTDVSSMTAAQLAYLAAVAARKEAERDISLAKAEEVFHVLVDHFKGPFSGTGEPPAPAKG